MDQWTPRTKARAELAEMLRDQYMDRALAAGLTKKDLDDISMHGRKAEQADEEQKTELALIAAERGAQKDLKESVFAREDGLRDRLPMIIGELWDANERDSARWLTNVSYARYRFREIRPPAPEPSSKVETEETEDCEPKKTPEAQVIRAVQRVERADVATRAKGLAAFCDALLEPGFEPIGKRLSERGYGADILRTLSEDARRLSDMGPNVRRAAKATAIEAEAARAQLNLWQRSRRMLRKAVQGVADLEKKWGEC